MEGVLLVLCLLIALVALVMGVFVVQTLKTVERKLTDLHKQVGRLQGEVASAEAKLKALTTAQANKGGTADALVGVLGAVLGGTKWGTLSKIAMLGYNQYKGRRKAGAQKALPPGSAPTEKHNG